MAAQPGKRPRGMSNQVRNESSLDILFSLLSPCDQRRGCTPHLFESVSAGFLSHLPFFFTRLFLETHMNTAQECIGDRGRMQRGYPWSKKSK